MSDFAVELRHRCRNPKCRSKLPAPVSNEREAFCCRGCFNAFYRHRCLICEQEMDRKNEGQKVCSKRKCRNALRQLKTAGSALGRYFPRSASLAPQEVPDFIESESASANSRAAVTPWLPKRLSKLWRGQPAWRWQWMLASDGSEREDNDWQLLNREGRIVARVRQEGDGYWMARPRTTPKPPIESFEDACRRAVSAAMATSPWPESERHPVHPGVTPSQYQATRRHLRRRYPLWSAAQVDQFIERTLNPNAKAQTIFKRDTPPLNVIGGYKFPDAPIVDLRKSATVISMRRPAAPAPIAPKASERVKKVLIEQIPDDLSIPDFLRRQPKKLAA
jgi:hypothetical protein